MSARDDVLRRVRAALRDADREPVPVRSSGAPAAVADVAGLFHERVEDYRATVRRVAPSDVADAVREALGAARTVVVPPGLAPQRVPTGCLPAGWLPTGWWPQECLVVDDGTLGAAALDHIDAVVTTAALGIAQTGTIVLDHGPGQGRRALSLVPDVHVCVLREADLVAGVPQAVARLAPALQAGRPLTWISGPSATSDIELERVEGVHGPRTLRVILVAG